MKKYIYILFCLLLNAVEVFAQYPQYFQYDTEIGLPSNEVYSMVQDKDGFIWIGCDAGLYKFDGVRYTAYKSETQQSKSITGLIFSSSEKLYCYNFQSQIFYVENDSLKELQSDLIKINQFACDKKGNLYVSHAKGISKYNELSKKWTHYKNTTTSNPIAISVIVKNDSLFFLTPQGIGSLAQEKINITTSGYFKPVGSLIMRKANNELFVFSVQNDAVYKVKNNVTYELKNTSLNKALQNRKITNAVFLPDNHLWITTYKGIVKYNPANDSVTLLYPEISFSDGIIDREGNYWFSALQSGLFRISNFNFIVWNKENKLLNNDKISKLATDSANIYFAALNGTIGKLNAGTNELKTFHTGIHADAQSLDYDFSENRLWFYVNNLYCLENNQLYQKKFDINVKAFLKIQDDYFVLNSYGVIIRGKENYKLSNVWARELQYDEKNNIVWIATNKGVLKCMKEYGKWAVKQTLFPETQILSVDFDKTKQLLYSLSFDGKLFTGKNTIAILPRNVQANKLKYFSNKIYIASNKGVWIYDLEQKQWNNLNTLSGLASENIQDLVILKNDLWLATGKGLQKIPLNELNTQKPLAKIYLKNNIEHTRNVRLNYGEALILNPEASIYSANSHFEYAYRINKNEWLKLPANIEQIEIQNLPAGNVTIELKAIDHLGRDSENTILLKGFVKPPFYKTWWFVFLLVLLFFIFLFFVVKQIIRNIRKREQQKTQLANSQLTAIKAQMNPHFIFNVLNSIKSYIYENNREKATDYLDDFSDLVRKILENSETQYANLEDELKILKLYIELEAMMLSADFSYTILVDPIIDTQTKIPAMMLQPYIENAFKHGLRHQKGDKKLAIHIKSLNDSAIIIEITDNGIGREESAKINLQNKHKKTSFATTAIQKRIALINAQGKQQIEIKTIDLNKGTQVVIQLKHCINQ